MSKLKLETLTDDQLVQRFTGLSLDQYDAMQIDDTGAYNRQYSLLEEIKQLLRDRGVEARRALLPLLDHKNAQVRLNAARELLAIEPQRARATMEAIADRGPYPQRGDAGMALWYLDGQPKET
jgi:hypothetical protein